jgi:hypothetical protein
MEIASVLQMKIIGRTHIEACNTVWFGGSNADMDNEQTQSSHVVIYGDNNKVKIDQRQRNIVDQTIEDIDGLFE